MWTTESSHLENYSQSLGPVYVTDTETDESVCFSNNKNISVYYLNLTSSSSCTGGNNVCWTHLQKHKILSPILLSCIGICGKFLIYFYFKIVCIIKYNLHCKKFL